MEHLKNILYYCHQNLILTIELMLRNICYDYRDNIWVKKLNEIVKEKKSKTNMGNNEIVGLRKRLCRTLQGVGKEGKRWQMRYFFQGRSCSCPEVHRLHGGSCEEAWLGWRMVLACL